MLNLQRVSSRSTGERQRNAAEPSERPASINKKPIDAEEKCSDDVTTRNTSIRPETPYRIESRILAKFFPLRSRKNRNSRPTARKMTLPDETPAARLAALIASDHASINISHVVVEIRFMAGHRDY